ncbi:hypothetical protein F2P81_006189 [Scophthalmus maximus]|uniref:Uncharacterized protein n=1 Tax=Scophthalmus maximus TaxID=52904 RepID=A0A6A4T8I5_SCOMX|nr:hypothetical protein F2P81_006189 [Scophthalmus maximus]
MNIAETLKRDQQRSTQSAAPSSVAEQCRNNQIKAETKQQCSGVVATGPSYCLSNRGRLLVPEHPWTVPPLPASYM